MRSPTSLCVILTAAALLTACGRDEDDARGADSVKADSVEDHTWIASRDCRRREGDSAQAVCKALNEVERGGIPAKVFALVRHGDTICVHTGPDYRGDGPVGVDGEAVVEVVGNRVVSTAFSDSIGCRGE
jgi:hypothetical protein